MHQLARCPYLGAAALKTLLGPERQGRQPAGRRRPPASAAETGLAAALRQLLHRPRPPPLAMPALQPRNWGQGQPPKWPESQRLPWGKAAAPRLPFRPLLQQPPLPHLPVAA